MSDDWPGTPLGSGVGGDWPGTPVAPPAQPGLLGNMYQAGKSALEQAAAPALKTINDTLNPFSDANIAATAERVKDPTRALTDWTRVGSGLAAIPALAGSPAAAVTKSAAPYVASPMATGIQAVGEPIARALDPNAVLPTHEEVASKIEPDVETALGLGMPARAGAGWDAAALMRPPTTNPVAQFVDPVNVIANAAKLAGKATAEGVGLMSGTGAKALETAASAGYQGGPAAQAFRANMRGNVPMGDVVDEAANAVRQMRVQRGDEYRRGMDAVGLDTKVLNFDGIDKAMVDAENVKNYKGQNLSPSTTEIRQKINDEINKWRFLDPAEFHTAEGFDALKQKIGDIRDTTGFGTPERKVANDAYSAVRQTIVKQVPQYATVMKGYEEASQLTKEIERTLSLPRDSRTGPTVDASLRKLQSILRNNVSTNYGNRTELAKYLVNSGAPHLMEALAGQSVNSWMPRGLAQLGARLAAEVGVAGLGVGAVGAHAALPVAASLPFMSPRLMGEAAYYAGKAASPLRALKGMPLPTVSAAKSARLANQARPALGFGAQVPSVGALAGANENQNDVPRPPEQHKNGGGVNQKPVSAHGRTVKRNAQQ